MKKIMKISTLFIFWFGSMLIVLGQQADNNPWCPTGAQWVYQGTSLSGGIYYIFEYEKDTAFNNVLVKKIKKKTVNYWYSGPNGEISRSETDNGYYLMYNSNDSIFIYINNIFKFLYDFTPNLGDTLPVDTTWATCSTPGYPVKQNLVVDSIYNYTYDGIVFNTIRYNDSAQYYYFGPLIKNIGSYNDIFPVPSYLCSGQINADYTPSSTLLCYYDSIRGEINFRQAPQGINCHMIKTGVKNRLASENLPFIMYPNPVNHILNIENITGQSFEYKIINVSGKICLQGTSYGSRRCIDVTDLPKGLYMLLLYSNYSQAYTFNFIKQ